MKPEQKNGLSLAVGDGPKNKSRTRLKSVTSMSTSQGSRCCSAASPYVSLPLYRAQRRRAVAAAEAHARRGAVIWNSLLLALMISAVFMTEFTLQREYQIQQIDAERW